MVSPVIRNLLSNAGGKGLIPGWGIKIPHVVGYLNPRTTMKIQQSQNKKIFKKYLWFPFFFLFH